MLERDSVRFKVIRTVRPKLACACCDTIVQAPAPTRTIERGIAGPALLAHILVNKYSDHLPLYRQSQIFGSSSATALNSTERCSRNGLARRARYLRRWPMRCASTFSPPTLSTPTTRPCRCLRRETERRRPVVSGRTFAMNARAEERPHRPCGSSTRPIAKASIRSVDLQTSAASCKPMRTVDSPNSTNEARFTRRRVGPMCVASSSILRSCISLRAQPKL